MVKLPTRDDLGPLPSGRSGRPIATVDTSAIAKGQIALGKGIASLGEAGIDIYKHQKAAEDYETDRKFQEFKWNEELGLEDASRNVEPGQAGNFAETWSQGYKERAKQFLDGTPPEQRQKYDAKLFDTERQLYRPAATFARTEQKRASIAGFDDFAKLLFDEQGRPKITSPETFEKFKTDYQSQIDNNPWLTPVEKDIERRKRLPDVEETYVQGLLTDRTKARTVLRDLGFDGDDAEAEASGVAGGAGGAPEEQASKGVRGAGTKPSGLIEAGNIDLAKRPRVKNADGSISTIQSMSVTIDDREVLIPTISDDGKILSEDEAVKQYEKTGKHLGIFDNATNATVFAKRLSAAQGQRINAAQGRAITPISFRLETGQTDPLKGVSNISRDSKGSRSYGNFGLNSLPGASAHQFAAEYGEALGLSGEPGTAEFDNSWKQVARADPEGLHQAELEWHNRNILPRVTVDLTHAGVDDAVATDPRVQAYFADRLIQYGPASIGNHESRVAKAFEASGGDTERFLRAMSEADRDSMEKDFPSALRTGVYSRRGHDNRVYGRLNLALAGAGSEAPGAKLPDAESYTGPYRNLSAVQRLRLAAEARTTLKQEAAEVAQDVRAFENIAEQGFAPKPGQLDALRTRVANGGDADTRRSFAEAESIVQWQDTARKLKPEELDAIIRDETERMRKGGATSFDTKRLAMADKLLTNMRQELKSDPLGWADRIGMVAVQPVDLSTPESAQASLGLRVKQAEIVAQRYGLEPKYLRDDEKQALTADIEAGGEQTLATTALIASSAGEHAPAILSEISKNSPTAAIIGGMVVESGPSAAARDAADGIALRKEPGFESVAPPKKETRKQIVEVMGSALANAPKTETAIIDATNAIYEVRARKQQLTEFDASVWQQALKEAIGEREVDGKTYGGVVDADPSWRGGRNIILPPFVAKEGWRDVIEAVTLQDLWQAGLGVPAGGDGQPVALGRVKGAALVQAGNGRYKLSLGNPDLPGEEKWITRQDAPDEIFEIDLHALRPILSQRRPELFAGDPQAWRQPSSMTGFEPSGATPW
jgi:hypothetical protein